MTELERERRRARDLERRLRALGVRCPPGTLEPLMHDAQLTRSAAGDPQLKPQRVRRYHETPITVR